MPESTIFPQSGTINLAARLTLDSPQITQMSHMISADGNWRRGKRGGPEGQGVVNRGCWGENFCVYTVYYTGSPFTLCHCSV